MEQIGQQLREAREARGLSLEDVEKATRIRRRFLEAIERGDRDAVGGDVYLRGFLRNYARFLGMDPDPFLESAGLVVTSYQFGTTATLPDSGPAYQPRYIEAPLRANAFPFARVILLVAGLALLGLLAMSVWGDGNGERGAWLSRLGISLPASPTPTLDAAVAPPTPSRSPAAVTASATGSQATATVREAVTAVPTATLQPRTPTPDLNSPTPAPTGTPAPTETPQPTQAVTLIVTAVERAWTEIYLEGSSDPVLYRTLEPGDQLEFQASQELYLRCGNSAGLELILNGEDLGIMGRYGGLSVRRWQADPNGGPPVLVESFDQ